MNKLKKILFAAIMVIMVIICIEGLARLTYFIMFRHSYSAATMYGSIKHNNYGLADEFNVYWEQEIIHPYLGFALDFKDETKNKRTYGISTTGTPLIKREPGKLNVVILGGSVAQNMGKILESTFTRLCRVPPNVVTLALGGYKQPQQLLALNFFLSIGAEYDLIINLDGFNDIVLPYTDNYSVGVNPFYPRNWNLRISRQPSKKILAAIGKVRYLRDLKEENLAGFDSSFLNGSAVFGIIKMLQFKNLNWEIHRSNQKLLQLQQKEVKKFEETGPFFEYKDPQQIFEAAAGVWVRSSILLNRLAREGSMEYYHFLQPNQYVKGSKVLTKEELRSAYAEKGAMSQAAMIGYPVLISQGKKFLERNINFFDATMVFAKEPQTVYIDDCCHFNERGKEILVEYMLDKIAQNPRIRQFFKEPAAAGAAKK